MAINLYGRNASMGLGDETIDDDATKLDIPVHAFDVIIADECHRGYTAQELSVWRNALEHFDAVKIGLTATPAKHTAAYFKDIVFRYEYQQAVREGHLVDYDAVAIRSEVRMSGVFLKAGETVGMVDTESGKELLDKLEDERAFDTTELEKKVTAWRTRPHRSRPRPPRKALLRTRLRTLKAYPIRTRRAGTGLAEKTRMTATDESNARLALAACQRVDFFELRPQLLILDAQPGQFVSDCFLLFHATEYRLPPPKKIEPACVDQKITLNRY